MILLHSIFFDGTSVLFEHFFAVLVFLLSTLGAGFLILNLSESMKLDSKIRVLASFSLGSILLSFFTYLIMLGGYFVPATLPFTSYTLLLFLFYIAAKNLWCHREIWTEKVFLFGAGLFFILLLLRLSYLHYILLPGYSDAPIHYQVIESFLHPENITFRYSFANIFRNYYHFGFHSIAAWMVLVAGISIVDSISLIGQLFLVFAPLSIFFLVYLLGGNAEGAFFAALLTAVGWHMPAFAINWGKFPAVAALSALPALVGFSLLSIDKEDVNAKKHLFSLFLLFVGLSLIHSRIVILVIIIVLIFALLKKFPIQEQLDFSRSVFYALLLGVVFYPLFEPLEYFYVQTLALIVLVFLVPFAFKMHLRSTVGIFLFTSGLWATGALPNFLRIPILLNREMLEIILYIPLSVLGGFGMSGMIKTASGSTIFQKLIPFLFFALIIFSFVIQGAIYPDPCCQYFVGSDASAFEFLKKDLPENSLILISSLKNSTISSGTDAGLWITPLLGLPTNNFYYNANWSVPDRLQEVCSFGAEHIFLYAGGRDYSFNTKRLNSSQWYELVFRSGKVMVYHVISCP